jgi:uncharacterized protein YegP (UPF0339 family)
MIHILKSRSGYRVRYSGKNGEPLAVSEVLTSKANAWKNVRAMMKLFDRIAVRVIDEKGDNWIVYPDKKELSVIHKIKQS